VSGAQIKVASWKRQDAPRGWGFQRGVISFASASAGELKAAAAKFYELTLKSAGVKQP